MDSLIELIFVHLDGYYAAECICKNAEDCDGSTFTVGNPQKCTAFQRFRARQRAVVRILYVICLVCQPCIKISNDGDVLFSDVVTN